MFLSRTNHQIPLHHGLNLDELSNPRPPAIAMYGESVNYQEPKHTRSTIGCGLDRDSDMFAGMSEAVRSHPKEIALGDGRMASSHFQTFTSVT